MQASLEARSHGSARREARTAAIRSICRLAAQPSRRRHAVAGGIVDQYIDTAEGIGGGLQLDLAGIGQIGGKRASPVPCPCIGTQGIQAGHAGADPGAGKGQRHFTANARAAAAMSTRRLRNRGSEPADPTSLGQIPEGFRPTDVRVVCHHRSNLMPQRGSESE